MGKLNLKIKFIGIISLPVIMMGIVLNWSNLTRTTNMMQEELKRRGISLARNLAHNSMHSLLIDDTGTLTRLLKAIQQEDDIAYVIVLNSKGKVLAHSDEDEIGKMYNDEVTKNAIHTEESTVSRINYAGLSVYDIAVPVISKGMDEDTAILGEGDNKGTIGIVRLGMSMKTLAQEVKRTLWTGITLSLGIIGVGIFVSFLFARVIVTPIEDMVKVAKMISDGDLTQTVDIKSRDEVGILGEAFKGMSGNLNTMIKKIRDATNYLDGVTNQITSHTDNVLENAQAQAGMAERASSAIDEIDTSIKRIAENSVHLSTVSEETSSSVIEMIASIEEVAKEAEYSSESVEKTASSIEEMSSAIKQVSVNTESLLSSAELTASSIMEIDSAIKEMEESALVSKSVSEEATINAAEGKKAVTQTVEGMEKISEVVEKSAKIISRLGQKSEEIGKILTVIKDVTDQTNLLALNAAILAAQAGDYGKGFGVVAEEIKDLADRTASSTKEIDNLIKSVQTEVRASVESMEIGIESVRKGVGLASQAGNAIDKIFKSVEKSSEMAEQIARATAEQSKGNQQVKLAMENVTQMIAQIVKATKEQSKGSELIMKATEKMRDTTQHVKRATEEQTKGSQQITKATEEVTKRIQEMSKATEEQKKSSGEVVKVIENVKDIAKTNITRVKEMKISLESLLTQTKALREEVDRFKV